MTELYYGLAIAPLTASIVQGIKQTGYFDNRFIPLLSVVVSIGLTVGAAVVYGGGFQGDSVFQGLIYGLAASGLYDLVKETRNTQ